MRIPVGIPALAIALVLLADVVLLTEQDQSTSVSLEDAVEGFRSAAPDATGASVPAGEATTATTGGAGASAPAATPHQPSPSASRDAATTAPAPAGPFTPPEEGVYSYRTRGYDEVSLGGGRHDYPERSYAALRRRSGCEWEVEHKVLEEHVERTIDCSAPGRLTHVQDRVDVTFFNQTNGSTYRCEPVMVTAQVDDQPGTRRTVTCKGDDGGQAVITTTLIGREKLVVGGVAVDAIRVLGEAVLSGRAEGTSRNESWVHAETGLMLKSVRKVQTRAKAFGTTVDYREDASYELEGLEPAR